MSDDPRLDDLLDLYEEALERGERLDVGELCADAPELIESLRIKIAMLETVDSCLTGDSLHTQSEGETLRVGSELTRLKFHARGGLGAVYRASESSVNREVAVKFIHHTLARDVDSRNRFALEAEVTGRLEHPGVVPLYGMGEADNGRMFYYMRFIDGETMDDAIRRFHQNHSTRTRFAEQSVEFRRLLTSFVSACKTVAYAHNRGIVHRDIKPANIMLGKYGETLVVDWGLAVPVTRDQRFASSGEVTLRPVSAASSGTTTDSGAGTAAYMSPEQASDLAPSPASDIYSLGATLYKILTGEPSISGDRGTQLKQQIITGNFARPGKRLASVPPALEAICLKAMALHPHDRYPTALDLAEDIENYLADADVAAYVEPLGRRLSRIARRHQSAVQTGAAALVAVLVLAIGAAVWMGNLASAEKQASDAAELALDQAQESKAEADAARKDNLRTSARFLADAIGFQIDQRWRILESARSSPELIRTLTALNANPEDLETRDELQRWLSECRDSRDVFRSQESIWVVQDRRGAIQARLPRNPNVIGQSFVYRDYFHGYGRDFPPDGPAADGLPFSALTPHHYLLSQLEVDKHLHSAHVSDVFHGRATGHLQVTFSVPIWDRPAEEPEKQTIGSFNISMEIQNLPLPANAMLVQTRPDQNSDKPGLVIKHRDLRAQAEEDKGNSPRLEGEQLKLVEAAAQLKRDRLLNPPPSKLSVDPLLEHFVDPVIKSNTGEETDDLAAFEPVLVPSRPAPINDVGWLVIVKESRQPNGN